MTSVLEEPLTKCNLLATFEIKGFQFAMDAEGVLEVVRLGPITQVSHSPEEVSGILNLRGRIVTILDTGLLLGLGKLDGSPGSRIFIIENQGEFVGLLVDKAGDVVEVNGTGLEPAPANVSRSQAKYIRGVFRTNEQVFTVLDSKMLVADNAE